MDIQKEYAGLMEAFNAVYENQQLDEGMTMKDFKQQRSRQKQKEKRAADKIAPNRRKDIHTDRLSPERAARHRANVDPDFEGHDERNYPGGKLRPNKVRKAKALGELGEGVDLFDVILEHLVAEGYADTNEAALAIMANMSEDWKQSIVEQSAIAARAAKVVDDQRQGYHGDSDAINKLTNDLSKSMGRLKRGQGPVVTPGLPGV